MNRFRQSISPVKTRITPAPVSFGIVVYKSGNYRNFLGSFAQPLQSLRLRILDIIFSRLSLTIHTATIMIVIGVICLIPKRWLRLTRK